VREREPVSRAEIARLTQLSATTVSEAVTTLLRAGFVTEAELGGSSGGRPPIMLRVNGDRGYIVGVDLDVGRVTVALSNLHLDLVGMRTAQLASAEYSYVVREMQREIEELMDNCGVSMDKLLGIGVGVPGHVDFEKGILKFAPNLGWSNAPLKEDMEHAFGVPVYIENDAKLCALGEKTFGVGQQATEIVFVAIKTGIGCGVVIDGSIYRGIDGSAGEFGHMTIDAAGPRCACGNHGCWETFADDNAIIGRALRELAASKDSLLFKRCGGDARRLTIEDVTTALQEGDEAAARIVQETAWYLGIGIVNIVNAFNPELVILGGQITKAGPVLFDTIGSMVRERALGVPASRVQIVPSGLGDMACVMGCFALVAEEQLEHPATLALNVFAHADQVAETSH